MRQEICKAVFWRS